MLFALPEGRLASDDARHALNARPRAECDMPRVAHTRHCNKQQPDALLVVACIDHHTLEGEALSLVDGQRPREHQRKLLPTFHAIANPDLARALFFSSRAGGTGIGIVHDILVNDKGIAAAVLLKVRRATPTQDGYKGPAFREAVDGVNASEEVLIAVNRRRVRSGAGF